MGPQVSSKVREFREQHHALFQVTTRLACRLPNAEKCFILLLFPLLATERGQSVLGAPMPGRRLELGDERQTTADNNNCPATEAPHREKWAQNWSQMSKGGKIFRGKIAL